MLRDPITAHGECFYACPGHRLFTSKFLAELANGWDGRSRLPRLQQRPFTRSDAAAAICGRRPQTSLEQAALVAGSTSKWKSVGNWMLHCAFASYGSSMPPGTQLTSPSWLQTSLGDFSLSLSLSLSLAKVPSGSAARTTTRSFARGAAQVVDPFAVHAFFCSALGVYACSNEVRDEFAFPVLALNLCVDFEQGPADPASDRRACSASLGCSNFVNTAGSLLGNLL